MTTTQSPALAAPMRAGTRVRVTGGHFAGITATVWCADRRRVVVQLDGYSQPDASFLLADIEAIGPDVAACALDLSDWAI